MSYFTTGKSWHYEKMMVQVPHPIREDSNAVLPWNHLCFGCKRQGESCTHPCLRELKGNRNLEVAICGLFM